MVASIADIRQWGVDNGWEIVEGARLPTGLRKAYDNRNNFPDEPTIDIFPGDNYSSRIEGLDYPDEVSEEIRPLIAKESPAGKARSWLDRVKAAAPETARPRGRKPLRKRVPIDKLISIGWQALAQFAQPINLPVARMLDMQAPVAGMVLEDVVRDTLVDRLLQPLARAEAGGEKVWALIGPPMVVAALQARPEMQNVLVPMLKHALRSWVDIAGEQLEKVKKQDEEFQEKYGTRIDDMIALIFAPPPGMDENGNRIT